MKDFANKLFTAVSHLTISKKDSHSEISDKEIKQSLLFFPFAGFYIGLFLVLINFITSHFLPSPVIDILLILFLLVFTEAKHLKGFLSMVTGITGFSKTKSIPSNIELKLFLVLFFVLMMKFILLNNIVPGWKNAVLLVMPVMGRWSLIFFPYLQMSRPRQNVDINPLYGEIDVKDFWVGTVITSIITLLLGINGIIIFMMITFTTVFFERLYQRKINGIPENLSLGIVEITEILTLLFFIALESNSRSFISDGILI
ncbi:MAG TPA: adenosylcobinamide-GDP ribazoletransferase [Nitrospinota bacterium]|jgi:cobalamin synthase|nr:adenosylcobinamide-GDP ribazoletransferase [Nitrospinota bacterium]